MTWPTHELVETLACTPAEGLRNLDRHLDRMADSASWFGFRFDRDAASAVCVQPFATGRSQAASGCSSRARENSASSALPLPGLTGAPVRLALDDEPVDSSSPWLQHKTTRRDEYRRRGLRHPHADDAYWSTNAERSPRRRWPTRRPARRALVDAADRFRVPTRSRTSPTPRNRSPARAPTDRERPARRGGHRGDQLAPRLAGCRSPP